MHKTTCTRATSARIAVREAIEAKLREIGKKTRDHKANRREILNDEFGLNAIYAEQKKLRREVEKIEAAIGKRLEKEEATFAAQFVLQENRLCDLRREILFATAKRIREINDELMGTVVSGKPSVKRNATAAAR